MKAPAPRSSGPPPAAPAQDRLRSPGGLDVGNIKSAPDGSKVQPKLTATGVEERGSRFRLWQWKQFSRGGNTSLTDPSGDQASALSSVHSAGALSTCYVQGTQRRECPDLCCRGTCILLRWARAHREPQATTYCPEVDKGVAWWRVAREAQSSPGY